MPHSDCSALHGVNSNLTKPLHTPFPTMCTSFTEKTTKPYVAISPHFSITYGLETCLTPCPGLLCNSKESYSKVHVIKNILENN